MKKALLVSVIAICLLPVCAAADTVRLKMSTTTSTDNSGLLDVLLPPFEGRFGITVDVIAVGTGKALMLGRNGDVDIVFVHARKAEDKFVSEGWGVNRRDVMYNDFVVVGPANDPAGIRDCESASQAFRNIHGSGSAFISRGDASGTHKKEQHIWKTAGVEPAGTWYSEVGQGMGAVLKIADEKNAYTLTDRGTCLAFSDKIHLQVLCEGDAALYNPYGIIAVSPARHSHVKYTEAMALIGWITSRQGQAIIRDFGKKRFGRPLFMPVAVKE